MKCIRKFTPVSPYDIQGLESWLEDLSLRGLFLRQLRTRWDSAATEEERETVTQAARFGLAALDHRDLG